MDEIAAAVDYTRRTLYAYFKSRDQILLLVLVDDLSERWKAQLAGMLDAETGLEKILTWGRTLFSYSCARPQSIRLQAYWDYRGIDENRVGRDVLQKFEVLNNQLADGLREIFNLGLKDGSLRSDLEIDLCISQYLYSLRIIIHRALSPSYSFASFDPERYTEHFLDLFSRGIRSQGANR